MFLIEIYKQLVSKILFKMLFINVNEISIKKVNQTFLDLR